MRFFRPSKLTSLVAVPILLAGLLASGLVFLEASPATATSAPGIPTLVSVSDSAGDTVIAITAGTGTVDSYEATIDGGNTWTTLVSSGSVWRYPNFNRSAQQPVQIRAVNEFGPSATTSAFTFPRFMLNNGLFRVGGGGHDSTTFTRAASIGANSQIVQPFYFDNIVEKWVKLTYSSAPFDFALGFGTGNEPDPATPATKYDPTKNWTGATVFGTFQSPDPFQNPVAGSASVTVEDFTCVFDGSSPVCMGTGTIVASADFLLGSKTVTVVNRYNLIPNSKFLEVTTSVENPGGSEVENVNVWVGTRDDWVGINNDGGDNAQTDFVFRYRADLPQKFRGTITDGVFQKLSSGTTERASALVLESIDGAGLFFSTSPNVNATIAPCCESLKDLADATTDNVPSHTARGFQNAVTLNPSDSAIATPLGAEAFKPANPGADFFQTRRTDLRDAGYAIHLPLGSIASGESKGATWFLGGTAYEDRTSLLQTVSEAAQELSQSPGSELSSGSGVAAPVVVPKVAPVVPTTLRKTTIRRATDDKPARLLGKSLNRDVLFVADSARLSPEARKSLRQAARLAMASDGKVAVTGFAAMTNRGRAYERSVALKRARVVARFLRARGFDDWIYFHGLSGRQSLAFEGAPRRVEIRILK